MISKSDVLRRGAQALLGELDRDRAALLKLLGEPEGARRRATTRAHIVADGKARRKYGKKPHWTQTPEGKARMSRLMKAKYKAGWKAK